MATAEAPIITDEDLVIGFARGRVVLYPAECAAMERLVGGIALASDRNLLISFVDAQAKRFLFACQAISNLLEKESK